LFVDSVRLLDPKGAKKRSFLHGGEAKLMAERPQGGKIRLDPQIYLTGPKVIA